MHAHRGSWPSASRSREGLDWTGLEESEREEKADIFFPSLRLSFAQSFFFWERSEAGQAAVRGRGGVDGERGVRLEARSSVPPQPRGPTSSLHEEDGEY